MFSEYCTGKNVEGCCLGRVWGSIVAFTWMVWGKKKPKPNQDNWPPVFNLELPKEETELQTTQPWHSYQKMFLLCALFLYHTINSRVSINWESGSRDNSVGQQLVKKQDGV